VSIAIATTQGDNATQANELRFSPIYASADLDATDLTQEDAVPSEGDADEAYRSKLVHALSGPDFSLTAYPGNWNAAESKTTRYLEADGWNAYVGGWNDEVDAIRLEEGDNVASMYELEYVDGRIIRGNFY
jgi:hypothetical protein